jgi:hypothetical protein
MVLVGLAGTCSCSGRKAVFPVRGQVLDAKKNPAVGAMLIFHPKPEDPKDPSRPVGTADENGNFTLTTYRARDGAPAGEYVITIIWPGKKTTPFDHPNPDQLGGRYADEVKSTIRFTVESKPDNEVPTIVLN